MVLAKKHARKYALGEYILLACSLTNTGLRLGICITCVRAVLVNVSKQKNWHKPINALFALLLFWILSSEIGGKIRKAPTLPNTELNTKELIRAMKTVAIRLFGFLYWYRIDLLKRSQNC